MSKTTAKMVNLRKPTIILATHNFFPYQWGGTEIYVHNLAKNLISKGLNVVIYASISLSSQSKNIYFEDDNVRVFNYQYDGLDIFGVAYKSITIDQIYSKASPQHQQSWQTLLNLTFSNPIEILHLNCFTPTLGLDLLNAAKLVFPKIKIVNSYHTVISDPKETMTYANTLKEKPANVNHTADFISYKLNIPYSFGKFLSWMLPAKPKSSLPNSLKIKSLVNMHISAFEQLVSTTNEWHVFSDDIKKLLIELGINQNMIVFERHGISDLFLQNNVPEKEGEIFLYNGRSTKIKGIITLLKAWLLTQALPNRKLWMCSDKETSDMEIAKQIAAADLRDDVVWIGKKNQQELLNIYQRAKYVIIPSECYETGPLVFHEAIACGCLVIASDIGGNRELGKYYEGQSVNFETGNARALASIIQNGFEKKGIATKPNTFTKHFDEILNKSKIYHPLLN